MSAPGWRTSLVVEGVDLGGRRVPVIVGLLETAGGDVQLAVRVGEEGSPVVLPMHAGAQLIVNVREMLLELVRVAGDKP